LENNYYKDNTKNVSDMTKDQKKNQTSFKENILSLFENKELLRVCIFGVIFGASAGAVLSHFTIFLSEDLYLSIALAGVRFGILQFGGIISSPMWGWASDKLFKRDCWLSLF